MVLVNCLITNTKTVRVLQNYYVLLENKRLRITTKDFSPVVEFQEGVLYDRHTLRINKTESIIICSDFDGLVHLYGFDGNCYGNIKNAISWFSPYSFENNTYLTFFENNKYGLMKVDLASFNTIWQQYPFDLQAILFCDDYIYCIVKEGYLNILEPEKGNISKQVNLKDLLNRIFAEIRDEAFSNNPNKILGLFENRLILSLEKGRMVTVNIEQEEIDWFSSEVFRYESLLKLSEDSSSYFSLTNHHFIVVDIRNNEVKINDIEDKCTLTTGKFFYIKSSSLHNNHIYFVGAIEGFSFTSGVVGAFNIESEQFDWVQELNMEKGHFLVDAPQHDGEKLYVMDSEGCLFVFAPQ